MIRTRKAFTLIELMVVIGILLVLIGLVAIGLSQIGDNQKAKSTQQMLEGLVSMHEEYKAKTNLRDIQTILVNPDMRAIAAPTRDDLFKSDALVQTQRMMKKMLAIPTNKSTMQQLPADRFMWEIPAGVTAAAALERDGSTNKLKTPLPLDAWGTPMLYVPPPDVSPASKAAWDDRYGLNWVVLQHNVDDPDKDGKGKLITDPPPPILNPRQDRTKQSDPDALGRLRTFRPFWVSAGPDGVFGYDKDGSDYRARGDDNIYSFENNQ